MGITSSEKTISAKTINCSESFDISVALAASPDIKTTPSEIVLVLDRSGSMGTDPLKAMKNGVNKFLDIIDLESDGAQDGIIGGGNKISIVSFSSTAVIDVPLTDSISQLKTAVNALYSTGTTNHKDAFIKAQEVLKDPSGKKKVIIIFTDGQSATGSEGFDETDTLKASGVTIYSMGYGADSSKLKPEYLKKWSSDPSSAYTLITPEITEIENLFTGLLRNITKAGATGISITETVGDCFTVQKIVSASKGSAVFTGKNTVSWTIPSLGTTSYEGAELILRVKHTGSCTGKINVNKSIEYEDNEGNLIVFANPQIDIKCTVPVISEGCPPSVKFAAPPCKDAVRVFAGDVALSSTGRIIEVNAVLKNICPDKAAALAAVLYEMEPDGTENIKGMKTFIIPPQGGAVCQDIEVRCIKFVVPLENGASLCDEKSFSVKFLLNYTDSDFTCCQ